MNKEFITYEQALELKELGFDEDVIAYWEKNSLLKPIPMSDFINSFPVNDYPKADWIAAPLYQQAFRWFREKFESTIHIYQYQDTQRWDFDVYDNTPEEEDFGNPSYDTYEEAELACLKKLIEIVKNK